jgi:hypothetical protein
MVAACASALSIPAYAGDWIITPRIAGQELFTDNVFLTPNGQRSDFVTNLSSGINITGESSRLRGTLDYSPTLYLYALNSSQDLVGQNLYANGTATIVRNLFFLDARGYASLQPSTPGLVNGTSGSPLSPPALGFGNVIQGIPKSELTQVSSFSASPYLVHRFDGFGTGELRYTVSNTNFSGGTSTLLAPPGIALQSTMTTTNEGTAVFFTGENFGPFAARFLLDAAHSTGSGVLNHASQFLARVDAAYALTRRIAMLATVGHEDLRFSGFPPIRVDDMVWGAGLRLTPSPDTTATLSYGHQNGVTAPYVAIIYRPSAITTLSADYSEGLSTTAQQIANNLAVSDVNQAGQLVDTRTLLPLSITNPALGLQSGLFRVKQFTGRADLALPRNHFTATFVRSENLVIAQAVPGSGISQRSTGGALSWSREISRLTTANLGVGYTHYSFPSVGETQEDLLTIGASISYLFNASLSGWIGYSRLNRGSSNPQLRVTSDIIFAGLQKTF